MTSTWLTPHRLRRAAPTRTHAPSDVRAGVDARGSTRPTAILDLDAPALASIRVPDATATPRERLHAAHERIGARVRPVYSMADRRPVSAVLRLGRGSCSQRLAVLKGVARREGIATRVRGLVVDGRFWYPRFRGLERLVPERILLAWPEFRIDDAWVDIGHLFPTSDATAFTNAGAETLFDALGRGAVRIDGPACDCADDSLARWVQFELGTFDDRDSLYDTWGQNRPTPVRIAIEPVFGRWSAGATRPLSRSAVDSHLSN